MGCRAAGSDEPPRDDDDGDGGGGGGGGGAEQARGGRAAAGGPRRAGARRGLTETAKGLASSSRCHAISSAQKLPLPVDLSARADDEKATVSVALAL